MGAEDDDLGRRFGRMQSGVFESRAELRDMHSETTRAAVRAARVSDARAVVGTQIWADEDVVLLGTGRARLTPEQAGALGTVVGELPLSADP
ncbi:MAG TPA: hypothetical protein VFJ28_06145 [Marmoricola sp.]|nr:hypothetical protein [Marmoricola sp.]